MGGEAKRKRAAAKPHRNEPPAPRYACPFPFCGKPFTHHEGTPDCCDAHRVFIAEMIFFRDHVRIGKSTTSGLVLPTRNPQVDAALQEMRQAAKREKKGG